MVQHRATRSTLDPADPFVVDALNIGRRPGSTRAVDVCAPAGERWGTDVIGVAGSQPIHCDLQLSSVVDGILVTGEVTALATGECARCLDPVELALRLELGELWEFPDSSTEQATEEDVRRLDGDLLDLRPALRDAVVLALPSTPVCSPDCAGLCVSCGVRLDDAPTDHGHDEVDPRWAALAELNTDHAD